ncbi:AMP-binding enzyme domain-containing protein [Sarocladium implicatum]|nr:AMP-binding enzyme domain-containing protein [Sarocladium implicatum]
MDSHDLAILNASPDRIEGPCLLHELVSSCSNHPAIEHLSAEVVASYTYAELQTASDNISNRLTPLRPHGARPFIVPVLLEQSPCLYASLLGILKAGGAFCPINIEAPTDRVKFILEDVSATVVLVSSSQRAVVDSIDNVHVIVIDTLELSPTVDSVIQAPRIHSTDPAYIMYTSGSTGTPKGVVISHDAASQALLAHESRIPAFSRFFQFASPTFDVSVFEIFFPLSRQKTLISADRTATLDNLPSVLNEMGVDACELTPTVAAGLLRQRDRVPTLQLLLTIGEMLNVSTVSEFGGHAGRPSMLWAMYGPTEATIHCTLEPNFSAASPTGTIGTPLDTVSCFILDLVEPVSPHGELNICSLGRIGELAVGGHQLATEYLNRPEQTAKAFIDTPFGRLYRTGDKARLNVDGRLECFGRISDGQVKLRGQRIELGEIEHAILGTPGCHLAAALVVDSSIIGFCTAEIAVSEHDVLNTCRDWLPRYMVPTEIVILPDLPRLPSGKIDKPSLKSIYQRRVHEIEQAATAPNDGDEEHRLLLETIASHLETHVSSRQSLASLGIDSLRAIRLASALREAGFVIDVASILRGKTVADICRFATKNENELYGSVAPEISLLSELEDLLLQNPSLCPVRAEIEDILSCTELQASMLTASLTEMHAYCNEIELEVDDSIPLPSLANAIATLRERTEILRTGYLEWERRPVAVVFRTPQPDTIEFMTEEQTCNDIGSISWMRPLCIGLMPSSNNHPQRMFIKIHHAIYDGWSMDAIIHDLSMLVREQNPPWRPAFRNLLRHLAGTSQQAAEEHRSFWADQFLGWSRQPFPVLIEQAAENADIESVTYEIRAPRDEVVRAMNAKGCGTPSLFLAALGIVWKGIMGSDDIVLGTVTSGRTVPVAGIHEMIGPMMAVMPLRIQFDQIETLNQLISYVEDLSMDLIEHASLPLSEIRKQARLQPWESTYDILFAFQESLLSEDARNGPFKTKRHIDRLETKVLIEVEPKEDGYSLQATFHTSALDSSVASLILAQVGSAFTNTITIRDRSLQSTLFEAQQVTVSQSNHPPQGLWDERSLSDHFEASLKQRESLPALVCLPTSPAGGHNITLTYGEINSRANQVARWLQKQGSQPGDVIGIMVEKSPLLYISVLGIMKAGCGYLPLLPQTPAARAKDIMKQASIDVCLVDDSLELPLDLKNMESAVQLSLELVGGFSTDNLGVASTDDRIAYVVYTSGTTGTPKGVSVTQKNITSNIQHLQSIYPKPLNEQPRFLQACSQAFDVSIFEIFFAWLSGMCLCTGTNDVLFADLERNIRSLKITHLSLTPTVAAMIDPKKVPNVEFLVTAGEPLTRSVLNSWGNTLWQGYGPSETTNICTVKSMSRDYNIEHLGKVFPNTSAVVLRPQSTQTLPIGWVGELCFGGQQVARGYMNAPDLTTEKFIVHERYGRLYRSGDLGRMLPDGSLVIMGRLDNQVKVRGQRVELAEIDAVLAMHGEVTSAITLLLGVPGSANRSLVSFYTTVESSRNKVVNVVVSDRETHNSVRSLLQARLPSYMVPSQLLCISHLPRTSNGKCDAQTLINLFNELPSDYRKTSLNTDVGEEDEGDWVPRELAIRSLIAACLDVPEPEIGRWTSLVGVGLDSISAIKVSKSLSQALEVRISISAILSNPCVALLEKHIGTDRDQYVSEQPIITSEIQHYTLGRFDEGLRHSIRILPCTPLQEAMLTQDRDVYYNKTLLRLRIPSAKMRPLWAEVARRHEIFRTCFVTTRDPAMPIVQVVLESWELPWHLYASTDLSMVDVTEQHLRTLPEPLDSRIPPISLAIINYRESCFLSFICHHALYDGTAMNVLWREIEGLAHGHHLPTPVPYEPFLREMRKEPGDWSKFWVSYFRDSEHTHVFASSRDENAANQASYSADLDIRLEDVQKQLRTLKTGLLSLCQASWALVLSSLTGSNDVVFGNVVSGRNTDLQDVERLVAPCFNTIPVRRVLHATMSSSQLLRSFHSDNLMLQPYQFSSVRKIAKLVGLRQVFDTLLLVQQPLEDMDDGIWNLEEDSGNMGMPMVCEVTPCPNLNTITVKIYYDMTIVTPDEAIAITTEFNKVARRLLQSPLSTIETGPTTSITKRPNAVKPASFSRQSMKETEEDNSPWNPLELTIRGILAELTSVAISTIKRSTSMFRLGVDSISAVQVAERLKALGYSLSTSHVLQNPTCESLSHKISSTPVLKDQASAQYDFAEFRHSVDITLNDTVPAGYEIEDILPCSPLQCAMAASSETGDGSYVNLIGLRLKQDFSYVQLTMAWDAVRRHHHMLRTALVPVKRMDSPYAMVCYSAESLELPLESISDPEDPGLPSQLKSQTGKVFHETRHLPPWKVFFAQGKHRGRMYLIIHHSLYDATSLRAIFADLAASLSAQKITSTPDPKSGLSEILTVSSATRAKSKEFWESYADKVVINRFPVLTPLREDEDRQQLTNLTCRKSFSSVQRRARDLGVTVQTVIEATWTRLLAAYTGEDEVAFGVTLSTRSTEATRLTPIPCLTTLPIITKNRATNKDLLDSLAEYDAASSAHRGCAMSDVQKWLGHPASPVFDTLITYQGPAEPSGTALPWTVTEELGVVEFPLALEVTPTPADEIELSLTYSTKRLPARHAVWILRQSEAIMESLLDRSDDDDGMYEREPDLFSVVAAEEKLIPTEVKCLHEFVERQAKRTPDAPALEFAATLRSVRKTWTYRELNEMGDRVAEILAKLQVRGSIVAVHFDKCPEAYFAILGILKAGFAFVALDPSMPSDRKAFIMEDSLACCLLTKSDAILDFDVEAPVQGIDATLLWTMERGTVEISKTPDPSDTCYCLYTSGTTGQPKGCEITHENTVQAMMAFQHLFREQYWSWSVGITLVVSPREVILDDLAGSISALGITHLDLTPSLARLLRPEDVPSLWKGVFITGGEQLKQEILDAWGPKGVIYNAYGPTEATIGVTTYSQVPQNGRPSNIGQQFLNVGTYVLHPNTDSPTLRGGVGELCIAGKLVGKGYINRDKATKAAFPWLSRFNERVYRTGDLVRLLSDGSFDFLGRADDQVKLRGQRLELGEIDHVIRSAVPDIQDVATIVVTQKSPDRKVLVCFLGTGKFSGQELDAMKDDSSFGHRARAGCQSKLPKYMIPTYFLVVPFIPLSINNKAEHKRLRRVFEELSTSELMSLTGSTSSHQDRKQQGVPNLMKIAFADFNGVDVSDLPPSTSLFELGVDSVNVALFAASVRQAGFACTPAIVLQHPTLSDLAEALRKTAPRSTDSSVVNARRAIQAASHRHSQTAQRVLKVAQGVIEYIAPCTPLQEGMVTIALTKTPRGPYFASFDLSLSHSVDLQALRDAWDRLIQRHAILRTSFIQTPEGCLQVALRNVDMDWIEVADAGQRTTRKQVWMTQDDRSIRKPIQFTYLSDGKGLSLCVDIFHGIYDGISLHNMLQELRDIYHGNALGEAPSFIEAVSHGPLQRFDLCKDFWKAHLSGWERSSMLMQTFTLGSEEHPVMSSGTLSRDTFQVALKRYGVTAQSLLLGLWTSALGQLCAQDPSLGLVIGGRSLNIDGIEKTIGPLFNTVPFFSGSCQGHSWNDLFQHCQSFTSSILDFQHVPLRDVQKWCNSGKPLFDTLFTVQVESAENGGTEVLWKVEDSTTVVDYPLAFEAILQNDGIIRLQVVANRSVITQKRLDDLLVQLGQFLVEASQDDQASWRKGTHQVEQRLATPAAMKDIGQTKEVGNFQWTPEADAIRQALAAMSQNPAEAINAYSPILELGLDSIDMLRLSSQLRQSGIHIAPSAIMRCETLADMMEARSREDHPQANSTFHHDDQMLLDRLQSHVTTHASDVSTIETVLPTTPLQEGMIMAMLQSDFRQYFNHEVLRLRGDVDVARLQTAWNRVIKANPVLRTGFAEVSDETLALSYCQVIHQYEPVLFDHSELELEQQSDFDHLFDLARSSAKQASGFRNMVQVRFASYDASHYMIISIAHALYDGWSLGLLYQDLQSALDHEPPARASAGAYASQHINRHDDEAHQFWKDFLSGAQSTVLSSEISSPEQGSTHRAEAPSSLAAEEILGFCKTQGVSFQALCYACWAVVLAQRTRQLDVSFGVVLAGRDFEGAEELMFPTMNTVAQRCILSGTNLSFLSYLDDNMRNIRPWQAYPLSKAMRASSGDRMLFDSLFMVQKSPGVGGDDQPIFEPIVGESQTDFALSVEAELLGDRLIWRATSQLSSYDSGELAKLMKDLNHALRCLIEEPNRQLVEMEGDETTICGLAQVTLHQESSSEKLDSERRVAEEEPDPTFPTSSIVEVLSAVSQVPVGDIKRWNSIYHLGIDSISAIKVSSLLVQKGVTLRPRDLLMATDISDMAKKANDRALEVTRGEHVDQDATKTTWTPPADIDVGEVLAQHGISPSEVDAILPALPAQVYMIRSWHMSEGQIFFSEFCLKLPASVSVSGVETAWLKLQEDMPLLRTSFYPTGSDRIPVVQVIRKTPGDHRHKDWATCWTEKDEDGGLILTLKIHHALYDAFSLPTLAKKLISSCSGSVVKGQPSSLEPWIKYAVQPTVPDHQESKREFWQKYFSKTSDVARDQPLYANQPCADRVSHVETGVIRDVSQLRRSAATFGTTVQALFLAAYARARAKEQKDRRKVSPITMGIYLANRTAADVLPEEYPTLCIVPIRVRVDLKDHLGPAALQVQQDLNELSSKGMAEVGLWDIKEWTGVTIDTVVNFVAKEDTTTEQYQLDWLPARVHEAQKHEALVSPSLFDGWASKSLADAYPPTIEIEASMDEAGMAVGIFGPRTRLSEEDAREMVRDVTSTLLGGLA